MPARSARDRRTPPGVRPIWPCRLSIMAASRPQANAKRRPSPLRPAEHGTARMVLAAPPCAPGSATTTAPYSASWMKPRIYRRMQRERPTLMVGRGGEREALCRRARRRTGLSTTGRPAERISHRTRTTSRWPSAVTRGRHDRPCMADPEARRDTSPIHVEPDAARFAGGDCCIRCPASRGQQAQTRSAPRRARRRLPRGPRASVVGRTASCAVRAARQSWRRSIIGGLRYGLYANPAIPDVVGRALGTSTTTSLDGTPTPVPFSERMRT